MPRKRLVEAVLTQPGQSCSCAMVSAIPKLRTLAIWDQGLWPTIALRGCSTWQVYVPRQEFVDSIDGVGGDPGERLG